MTDHDVIVLGGGPGGYIAAERLGHAGKKVLLVEAASLGGTCLNVGCIPTKTLLGAAKTYDHARHGAQFGVKVDGAHIDWPALQKWKDKVVSTLVGGVAATEKKAGVTVVHGHGTFDGPGKVTVDGTTHTATHVILATGSVPVMPPIPGAKDNPLVIDSTGALSLPEIPERLAVIGGGVIGVEFASLYSMLGTQVTVIEMLPEIVPFADDDVAAQLRKALKDVNFKLGCRVTSIDGGKVNWTTADGAEESVEADHVLMAVGRRPAVDGWGAENTGLEYSGRGVVVDDRTRTNLPNVWAIGDVTGRSLLAHAAYRMGEVAAANILDAETRQVLGIHVLGSYAAEMTWGASTVLETELDLTDLRQLVFPHPTVSELIREAAWAAKA